MNIVPKTIQALILIAMLSATLAHHFTGTYQDQQGIIVSMDHKSDGQIQGMVQMQGQQFQLQGQGSQQGAFGVIQTQAAQGSQGSQFGFQAQISADLKTLEMVLYPPNAQGQPDTSRAQKLTLQRTENATLPDIQVPDAGGSSGSDGSSGSGDSGSETTDTGEETTSTSSTGSRNPLSPDQTNQAAWAGIYSDGELTMSLQNANNIYQGMLELNGTQYPLQAKESMTGLDGVFLSGNDQFEFTVVRQGSSLVFTTGGNEYILTAQAAAQPVNPLGN